MLFNNDLNWDILKICIRIDDHTHHSNFRKRKKLVCRIVDIQLIRAGLSPIYIKVEDKKEYLSALSRADKDESYDEVYEIIFKVLLRSHSELTEYF